MAEIEHYSEANLGGVTPLSEWIDNADVMQSLRISLRTLQTLRSNGTLPYMKFGNKVYYKRRDLEQVLEDAYTMQRLKNEAGYGNIRK